MTTTKRSTVVGVFHDRDRAEEAVHALRQAGFREDHLGVIAKDVEGRGASVTAEKGSKAGTGAVTGAAAGAGAAALASLGITFGVIPVIGPILAIGPLAAALMSAVGGAAAGSLVGGLIGLGIPEEEAKYYEGEMTAGRTLVTVKADGRYDEAVATLRRFGAYDMHTPASTTGTAAATRTAEAGGTVKLHEEELHARKQPVETGEVRVRKEVVTEQKQMEVPLTREEVVVERHPVAGRASSSDIRPGEEVRIPVKEEQVHVQKETVAKEEVSVGKRKVTDTETVGGTVRKEEVRIEKEGDVNVDASDKTRKETRK